LYFGQTSIHFQPAVMKNNHTSRRQFLALGGAALAASALPQFGLPAYIPDFFKPKSLFKGVQIGTITYSFREMPDQSAEAVLKYVLDCGISAIELMGEPVEAFAGAPKNPVDFRAMFPLMRKRNEKQPLTEDEQKRLTEMEVQRKAYGEELSKWRLSVSMDKFVAVRKMYNAAGVKIYGFKPSTFGMDRSDAEIEYGMKAAKVLGANQVTLEHPSNDAHTLRLGQLAQKHKVMVGYHGHEQQTPTFWDTALAQSPANALNLDLGHYVAAGQPNPLDLVRQKHDRISSMHIKDRQLPANGKGNLPWGTGDTPLAEVLKLMSEQKYKFPAAVELEYKIPEGSNSVKEVQKCVEFCRKALGA
jgi:sugar phosphate isomerase/epimerase